MATDDNNQNFDDFLEGLKAEETLVREKALNKPVVRYNEWAYHLDLAKRQFTDLWNLFGKIEQDVPNWKRELRGYSSNYVSIEPPIGIKKLTDDCTGYWFEGDISRRVPDTYVSTGLGFKLENLGSEEYFTDYEKLGPELLGLDEVRKNYSFNYNNAVRLLNNLDKAQLTIRARNDPVEFARSYGIGYLYEHNLADVAKKLFMLINKPGVTKRELEIALPEGTYVRRPIPEDDNTIIPTEDSKWRNDR